MSTVAEPETTLHRVPFDALTSFNALFERYCTDYDALAEFFAGDFNSPEGRAAAAQRAADHARDRATLADVLLEQNARWGLSDATRRHIESLRQPDSVAVVTGQQVGLLGGPLYTPYKTITSLQLARQLSDETGRPVIPVFWLEGEDHDFDEVAGVALLRDNDVQPVRYEPGNRPTEGNPGPVGRLVLTEDILPVLDALDEALRPTDFKPQVMEAVREAYRPGTTLLDAFGQLMNWFFPDAGLVLVDPSDARLKQLAAPLFRREINASGEVKGLMEEVSERLRGRYHAQVTPRSTNLFLVGPEGRHAIDVQDGTFEVRGTGENYSRDDLNALLDAEPERFSPNVVFRPLVQDLLFPTAAYVAGPGEVSYFAQFKPVYVWAGIPMPVIYPRASATLVESKVQKVLDRYDLALNALEGDPDQLFQRIVMDRMEVDVEAAFKTASRSVHEAINELKASIEAVDKTLGGTTEATRAALAKELDKLKDRVIKAEKRKQDEMRGQIDKARINLFPLDRLQERVLSPLYFLNKYGPDLIARLQHVVTLDTTAHQVVHL